MESVIRQQMHKDVIQSGTRFNVLAGWLVVLALLGVGAFMVFKHDLTALQDWLALVERSTVEARRKPLPFIVGGIAALVFVGIVIKLLVETISLLRFGVTALRPDPDPGSVGGHLGGTLHLRYSLQAGDKATVTVICWRHYVRRTRSKRESVRERVWSDEVHPEMMQQFNQLQLRFTVDLPVDVLPSGKQADDTYRWEVVMRIERKGRDIVRAFKVPVSKGDSPRYAARPMRHDRLSSGLDSFPGLVIDNTPGMLTIRGLPGRNPGLHLTLLLFGLVFGGAGVFLGYGVALDYWQKLLDVSRDGIGRVFGAVIAVMTSFMALVFSAVGLLLGFVAVSGARNCRELSIENQQLSTRNRGASQDIPLHEIERFEVSESGSVGISTFHDVHAVTSDGSRAVVLEGIPGQIAVKRIVELLEQHTAKPFEMLSRPERRMRSRLWKAGRT